MLTLQQNIKLQQRLSPQQIQLIKMLEYPALELEERVRQELVDNPALELGREHNDDTSHELDSDSSEIETLEEWANKEYDYIDSNLDAHRYNVSNYSADDTPFYREQSSTNGSIDALEQQLQTINIEDNIMQIAKYIIGSLDPDGYLRRTDLQILDEMIISYGMIATEKDIDKALEIVQSLEPAGIGARDLQECLLLQLYNKDKTSTVKNAITIVNNHFDHLAKASISIIAKKTKLSEDDIKDALDIIKHLEPKPGNVFSAAANTINQTIAPDFIVSNINGELIVELITQNIPELKVSKQYSTMLEDFVSNKANQNKQTKEAMQFARQKIENARWFIDVIKQRNETLILTMNAIVDLQREYFLSGDDVHLKPMKLKDVAEKINMDISTISRVNNSKYVETQWGIFPLKYFFSESIQLNSGEEVSNKEVKQIIKETIANEDKNAPATDEQISKTLNEKGYKIARRTVAKYRESLKIPNSSMRKK